MHGLGQLRLTGKGPSSQEASLRLDFLICHDSESPALRLPGERTNGLALHKRHRHAVGINHTALAPWMEGSKYQGNSTTCSQKTLSVWQLFYLNKDVSWLYFSWEIQGVLLQNLYDSHLNFCGKEHRSCTNQYVPQSTKKQQELFLGGKVGQGPRRSERDMKLVCEDISERFWTKNN